MFESLNRMYGIRKEPVKTERDILRELAETFRALYRRFSALGYKELAGQRRETADLFEAGAAEDKEGKK